VFLAIFKPESTARKIRALLKELDDENVRVYTSILTVQEASVLGFRRGTVVKDNISRIGKIARIVGVNPDIALTAAKLEAHLSDSGNESERDRTEKKRRKWDCFHIATAQAHNCAVLYAEDKPMQKRRQQLGITTLKILPPRPRTETLFDKVGVKRERKRTKAAAAANTSSIQGNNSGRAEGETTGEKAGEEKTRDS
jgi:predicted nucleic acid-binding protein